MAVMGLPIMVAIAVLGVLIAAAAIVYIFTRMDFERRVRIARFLGKAFIFLIAGSLLAGMVVQFIR